MNSLKILETILFREPPQVDPKFAWNYIGGRVSQLQFLGLKVPQLRKSAKIFHEHLKTLPLKERTKILTQIWLESPHYETLSVCLECLTFIEDDLGPEDSFKMLCRWMPKLDNWAHSDGMSSILARILEKNPSLIAPSLKKWNGHKQSWYRRQSLVSLFYYASQRKKHPPKNLVFRHLENCLADPEYYVQKAVGWTLREASQVYHEETLDFMDRHLDQISATAFSAACEKLKPSVREAFKKKRKLLRSKRQAPQ